MKLCLKKDFLRKYLFDARMSSKEFAEKSNISLPTAYSLRDSQYEPYPCTRAKLKKYFIDKVGMKQDDIFEIID